MIRHDVSHRSLFAVVLWMTGALFSFAVTAVSVRALSPTFSVFEILSIRNGAAVALLLSLAAFRSRLRPSLVSRRLLLHLVRNVLHFAGTAAWTLSLTLLPLATAFALEFTAPAWVALLAVPFLGEKLTQGRLAAVVLGLIGVLVILRPGIEAVEPAGLAMLAAAVAFALVALATKRLTETESTFAIVFFMNLMQLPMNLAGVGWGFWNRIAPGQALPLVGICMGGLLAHFCLTNAYRHGDASMVVPLDFLRVPLIALVGWTLYGETLDPYVFVGSACIIAGILYSLHREAKFA